MVVIKNEIAATTTIKGGRVTKTVIHLPDEDQYKDLRSYLKPMVTEFVKRRILPMIQGDGLFQAVNMVKIRESKSGQTIEIESQGFAIQN